MNDLAISEDLLFGGEEGISEFLSLMGVDPGSADDVIQDDGSLILAIGDRALSIEQQSSINALAIMAFIANTAGLNVDAVLRDLMVLNARPHDTGGLIFGLLGSDVIVGTLIVAEPSAVNVPAAPCLPMCTALLQLDVRARQARKSFHTARSIRIGKSRLPWTVLML